ncbi:putative acetylcholine receptor chaperone isoform X2 [Megalopta genalis]|uniref:putative acetylcholine receptor chaperone isoform X2 n=1 Tax=Megalopta genalis TaxID=115081 RepID=UPI003FD00DA5
MSKVIVINCGSFWCSAKYHRECQHSMFTGQRKEYVKYAKVFPLSGTLDFKVPSKWYRRVVGSLEIICGLAMAIVPSHKIKNASNAVLLLLMLMAVYSHYMVNDKFERIAPALVFFFMLTGRLVIDWQLRREDAQSVTANGLDDKTKKQD